MYVIAACLLILSGLILPGQGWARAGRWPAPLLTGSLLSWLSILVLIVGFDAVGIPLRLQTLGPALLAEGLLGFWVARRTGWKASLRQWRLLRPPAWLLLLLPLIAVSCWKMLAQPLSGLDTAFRWDHLARLMIEQQGLAHYPAVLDADFRHYFWADGITPLCSSLHAWAYLAAGSTHKGWSAIPGLLLVVLLLRSLFLLGRAGAGDRGGAVACLVGAACFILQFAVNMGQETGLTAIGVTAMCLCLLEWERGRAQGTLLAAACCGALAACAREYAMLFPVLGAAWMLSVRGTWRLALGFCTAALLPAGLWCLRNLWLTGNPLYCMDLAGLFPLNPVFDLWMKHLATSAAPVPTLAGDLPLLMRYLLIGTLPALAGLLGAVLLAPRQASTRLLVLLSAGVLLVWWISIPLTAGGLFYSMRVLSPMLCLGAGAAALCLGERRPGRLATAAAILVVGTWILDASARALTVPANPHTLPLADWPQAGDSLGRGHREQQGPFLEQAASRMGGLCIGVSPEAADYFRRQGRVLVPLWSPELAFLLRADCSREETAARLRALGYSHLLLNRLGTVNGFFAQQGILDRLGPGLKPVAGNELYLLYALP